MFLKILFFISIIKFSHSEVLKNKIKKNLTISTVNEDYCRCSGPLPKSRVVNGTRVIGFDYEWVVGIYSQNIDKVICTGSLISASTILTAAHCFDKFKIENLNVFAGFIYDWHKIKYSKWGSRKIISVKIHSNYSSANQNLPLKYDIAIAKLDKDFILGFNNSIYLACILENEIQNPEKLDYYFAGYGVIKPFLREMEKNILLNQVKYSKSLNHIKLKYHKDSCDINDIKKFSICVYAKDGSLCNADSGGPIHIFVGEKLVLTSFLSTSASIKYNKTVALECSKGGFNFGIKLSNHLDFIKKEGNPKCLVKQEKF